MEAALSTVIHDDNTQLSGVKQENNILEPNILLTETQVIFFSNYDRLTFNLQ